MPEIQRVADPADEQERPSREHEPVESARGPPATSKTPAATGASAHQPGKSLPPSGPRNASGSSASPPNEATFAHRCDGCLVALNWA